MAVSTQAAPKIFVPRASFDAIELAWQIVLPHLRQLVLRAEGKLPQWPVAITGPLISHVNVTIAFRRCIRVRTPPQKGRSDAQTIIAVWTMVVAWRQWVARMEQSTHRSLHLL